MKKLALILTLLFTVLLSAPSYAEWTKVGTGASSFNKGTTFYVDFEGIRKVDGYVYYWNLTDYLKPTKYGDLSSKVYYQGDCKLIKIMRLSASFYTQPMGEGQPSTTGVPKNKQWQYPTPNSVNEFLLKAACNHVK